MWLTNRETAFLIWVAIFGLGLLRNSEIRGSIGALITHAFDPALVKFALITTAYIAGEVVLLRWCGIWTPDLLKETVLWVVLIGLSTAGRTIATYDSVNYRAFLLDSVRITVFIQFFVGLVQFSLLAEVIIAGLAVFIGLGTVAGELPPNPDRTVQKLFNWLQVAFGIGLLIALIHSFAEDPSPLRDATTWRSLLLPAPLSVLFAPALFLWRLRSRYEWLFLKLNGPQSFRWWARWWLVRKLRWNESAVLEFGRRYAFDLPAVRDKQAFLLMTQSPTWRERQQAEAQRTS